MATIDDLKAAGYDVGVAMFADAPGHPTVYFVEGHDHSAYVPEDDTELVQGLLTIATDEPPGGYAEATQAESLAADDPQGDNE